MYRKDKKREFYTRKAKKEGYPARSVYKLKEINDKLRVIRKNDVVLDLGCAPGSWIIYISDTVGPKGRVLGIDIEDIKIPPRNNISFIKKDILEITEDDLKAWQGKCDALVADLAPKTTGVIWSDVGKSLELSEKAFEIAKIVLRRGGSFISKIFEGECVDEFVKEVEKHFEVLKRVRPMAVIKHSKEFYIVAKKFTRQ
ncbi:RlmE family RNA methyltransferase [Patescibacteria group bacterium]|nr:RlmE family RNA methyltransferase [Patescibacteria group bacterium]